MQVTETLNDGLKRTYKVVVAAADIAKKIDFELDDLAKKANLPGFRPGKAPKGVLKKRFGQAVMGDVLQRAVQDSSSQAMLERGLKPAMQPQIEVTAFDEGKDLEYNMSLEVLPDIVPVDFKTLELERLKAEPSEADVAKALESLSKAQRKTRKVEEARAAKAGDTLVIDFEGFLDGEAFPGGKGADHHLELGSNQFVKGFEDQLIGKKAGDACEVNIVFPAEYVNDKLAGKPALFKVTVKELREAEAVTLDDEFAKGMGFDDLDTLKKVIKDQLAKDYGRQARAKLKRDLLDKLAAAHSFEVPPGMLDMEFQQIWGQVEADRKRGQEDPEHKGKTDDQLKEEYKAIALRRVRLGLLLAEVGRANDIQVAPEEVNRALGEQARRFPGQERQVVEYYRSNPELLAQLRAPIFEDKVVDFILELAKVAEKTVTTEELFKEAEAA
ncbi:MAG: trigger factor [Azospirillum sp.]|nr:trigger factor [Azospirillum sp.]MCZ8124603.1 trigger factor [Magnetospirillum sp.]